MRCPHCNAGVRYEPSVSPFFVCNGCCEMLAHDEVIDLIAGGIWPYFEAYLGTEAHPQAINVWGWHSHADAADETCGYVGDLVQRVANSLHDTLLCVDADLSEMGVTDVIEVLTIRKALSVPNHAHPILHETTTRLRQAA